MSPRWIYDPRHVDEVIAEHERRRRRDPERGVYEDPPIGEYAAEPDDEDPPVPRPRIY